MNMTIEVGGSSVRQTSSSSPLNGFGVVVVVTVAIEAEKFQGGEADLFSGIGPSPRVSARKASSPIARVIFVLISHY